MTALADAARDVRARIPWHVRRPRVETVLVALVAAAVLVAHSLGHVFHDGFWLDEDWVAITTRYPLSDLAQTTSSTPIGWSFLLRLVPFGGAQSLRVVPLLFTIATVPAAYVLAHRLPWANRFTAAGAGLTAAVAALLVPAMLVRNDLKQYTADAAIVLVVLATTSRLERDWSRRNLALLGGSVVGGMLFSHPAAFLGIAAYLCVVGGTLVRRNWPRARDALVAGTVTAGGMAVVYVAFDKRAVNKGLTDYWSGFYVPTSGPHAALSYLHAQWQNNERYLGLGPFWIALPLFAAGVVTIVRLGRPSTGLTPVVLIVEMIVLSAAKKYPFLDLRTGTFVFVVVAVVAAIGLVGIAAAARRWARPELAAGFVAVFVGLFILHAAQYTRERTVPDEPLRTEVSYVAAHRAPGDVVLVSSASADGFAYYWPGAEPAIYKTHANLQGYLAVLPNDPDIVTALDRKNGPVLDALRTALTRAAGRPGARIWLIRTHLSASEDQAWRLAFRSLGVVAVATGSRGLIVLLPGS